MVAWLGFPRGAWRRRAASALGFGVWRDDAKSWSIKVGCVVPGLVGFPIRVGDVPVVARESRVRALFHALPPRLAPKVRWLCLPAAGKPARRWRRLLHRPVKVDADSIARLARVLVGQREHKGRCITDGCRGTGSLGPAHASLGLTKVNHVDGEGEVCVVRRRVAAQQLGYLDEKNNSINTRGN